MAHYIDQTLENIINIKQNVYFLHKNDTLSIPDVGNRHDFWEIVYIEKGSVFEFCDETPTLLTANDILFHKPGEFSKTRNAMPDVKVSAYFISFKCSSSAMEFFKGYRGTLSDISRQIMKNIITEAKESFKRTDKEKMYTMLPAHSRPIGGPQMYKIHLESLLINILREENRQNPNGLFSSKEDFYNSIHHEIAEYLANNIYESVTLDDICDKFSYSKTFLCSSFKKAEGVSIMTYFNTIKIAEACRLIEEENHSMSHISNMLKFNNQYYFSRVFKRIKGITPMDYKKVLKLNSDVHK
ncbi:MAG: helix-turn-helix transcriptional regulator [Clostridia bacterium]|nr:helix-turn-helix transcriptional regulator [Clostridia bacterium]